MRPDAEGAGGEEGGPVAPLVVGGDERHREAVGGGDRRPSVDGG